MNILVLDVGTSSIRGVLYDEKGHPLFWHPVTYQVRYFGEGWADQNPADWSDSIVAISKACTTYAAQHNLSIDALSLTSQRSSVIPVGYDGEPLYPAIMWQDKRNASIVEELAPHREQVHHLTGARINTVFSGTKMTWFRRNEPELYQKTMKFCTIADFIVSRITGAYVTDHTYGARSLLMNIRTRAWDATLLELFEVEEEKLCTLISPGSVAGTVTEDFARKTGLKAGIPLISAGGDQQCAALGQGVTAPGSVEITTGTGAFILGYCDCVPEALSPNVICGTHAIPGKYVLESSMLACAAMYNWTKRTLFSESDGFDTINQAVEHSPAGANGCLVLPYFQGRGTPDFNSQATGMFANLHLGITRDDMARALLESIAYEANSNLAILEGYMGGISTIHIGGGLTKFGAFNQLQADVYQKPLTHDADSSEQTSFGAWASAAVTLGLYDTYEAAMSQELSHHHFTDYLPRPEYAACYHAAQQAMEELYNKLYHS